MTTAEGGERLRVLQVVETLEVGGMERMVATLCRSLDPTRYAARVLVTRLRGAIGDQLAEAGVAVDCAGLRRDGIDYAAIPRLVSYIRGFRPHVVHTHATHALLYGAPAARLSGVPVLVHTEHGRVLPDRPHVMRAERWLSRFLVRYAVVSEELAEAVHRHERIPRERIEVIPNGVADLPPADLARITALRAALVGGRPGPVVGVAARLVWEKGLDVLLRAWAARRTPPALRSTLVVAGEGPERGRLERLVQDLGMADSVVLPGTIADVSSFYRMIDLFVLSSVSEGLPMALLEAMAAGLPIVATRVGGVPAALDHGAAGVLVNPSDHDELARAIDALLGGCGPYVGHQAATGEPRTGVCSAASAPLGLAARQRFETCFTARAMTSRYAALYSTRAPSA